jgi:hypothetical protein
MLETGIFPVPGAMSNFLQEEFELLTPDCSHICRIKIKKYSGWSLARFFERRGGDVGDYMVLKFNVHQRQIQAYLGDSDLVDEFQSDQNLQ